ncbi:MAG: orotidine-5'-phosphate decarboxylase [Verrucomicrobia bacterium]|nr:orotidine-5'-phosphate decarboxylase [Verrucomicrobiota bacterium]
MQNPILVALDVPTGAEALRLAQQLAGVVGGFKVGSELFTHAGPSIVRQLRELSCAVFLDLKFHDIPNTVAKAVAAAVQLDVQMLTVHTGGGRAMMAAAEQSAQEASRKIGRPAPLVLGVTVLTSLNSNELSEVGVEPNVGRQVERLAELAVKSGLRGLVCSPLEIARIREIVPSTLQLVTPGIRGPGDKLDDQKRTLSPSEAIKAGSDWLVIGRPIYAAPDPKTAAQRIAESLTTA